jgi:hypothetical protein
VRTIHSEARQMLLVHEVPTDRGREGRSNLLRCSQGPTAPMRLWASSRISGGRFAGVRNSTTPTLNNRSTSSACTEPVMDLLVREQRSESKKGGPRTREQYCQKATVRCGPTAGKATTTCSFPNDILAVVTVIGCAAGRDGERAQLGHAVRKSAMF